MDGNDIVVTWEDYLSFAEKFKEMKEIENSKKYKIHMWLNKFAETFYNYYVENIRDIVDMTDKEREKKDNINVYEKDVDDNFKNNDEDEDLNNIQKDDNIKDKNKYKKKQKIYVTDNDNSEDVEESVIVTQNNKNKEVKNILIVKKDINLDWNPDTHFNMNIYNSDNYL